MTGFWLWQTVVVPPNVYVIHTRRGHPQPVTIGLGVSFRFNPYRDAFLLVPAAMQTIIINARCICSDRQGVLVQAYVQWIVDDVRVAYRRLDFSDPQDPMRLWPRVKFSLCICYDLCSRDLADAVFGRS